MPPPLMAQPGDVIAGRYTVGQPIGRGATADIFEATDAQGGSVALKILRAHFDRDPVARLRFEREVATQERIRHPNVARLHGAGITGGHPYLAIELVRGRSLAHVLGHEGRLDPRTAGFFIWQALRGLGAAHEAGVLHRDLKPGNLVIEPTEQNSQRLVVIDFGFAALEGGVGITQQGFVVGSLSYMAPERLSGTDPVDERSDLYALGIVFFELLTAHRPFEGDDTAVATAHLESLVPAPSSLAPGIPAGVDAFIARATARRPEDRYASAAVMADALKQAFR